MAERKDFLTATEVMERLRLGRTTVYEQARLFLETDGAEGIPCRRIGRSLRFPTAELEAMAGGPITVPEAEADGGVIALADVHRRSQNAKPDASSKSRPRATRTDQSRLPFTT